MQSTAHHLGLLALMACLIASAAVCAEDKRVGLEEFRVRDPFILPDVSTGTYYLVMRSKAGVCVRTSRDLVKWSEPVDVFTRPLDFWAGPSVWAPELHAYNGKYYLFATFMNDEPIGEQWPNWPARIHRGTQILVADAPTGPFRIFANHPHTPEEEMALDGTLWVQDGVPYMVYCHEWVQIRDGAIKLIRLKDDLSAAIGEPKLLFRASQAGWTPQDRDRYVTDGPAVYRTKTGTLLMLWSSFSDSRYTTGIAKSESGSIHGPWTHQAEPLFSKDGGHAMVFRDFEDRLILSLHSPNRSPDERCRLFLLKDTGETLRIEKSLAD
jgi:GH43 family beta-xylosidase